MMKKMVERVEKTRKDQNHEIIDQGEMEDEVLEEAPSHIKNEPY